MTLARRVIDPVRRLFALNEGRPVFGRGIRTAFALLVPIIAGDLLVHPLFAWAGLGGWLGSLADKGGSYRTRATTMAALLVLGAACAYAGSTVEYAAVPAVLSMLAAGVLGGLGRVYGDEGSTVGLFIAVLFAVAVGSKSEAPDVGELRAAMFAGGVAWAMVLSLLLWPLHPFRPARRAAARCYRDLAQLARALEELVASQDEQRASVARDVARSQYAIVRSGLEDARVMLAGVRRPRSGRSPRGEHLLVLTEGAEQLFGELIAIQAELEAAQEAGAANDGAFETALTRVADTLESVATAIDDTVDATTSPRTIGSSFGLSTATTNLHLRAAESHLARLSRDLELLVSVAVHIDVRASSVMPLAAAMESTTPAPRDLLAWIRPIRDAISPRTFPMRHALRMGIASAAAVSLSFALDITRGYWATITVLIVLQPYAGATVRKTLQRVAGSVGGGILAAALAVVARTKLAIAAVMFPLTVGSVAALPLNYGVFVFLLTPVFVLLAEPHPGDWPIAGLRVANTLLGGAIALVAAQLLWPARESETYAPQLASLLRELRAQLVAVTRPGDASTAAWRNSADAVRRQLGIKVSNAEATLQRLIAEESPSAPRVEAAMTMLTYSRRMASTLSAIAAARIGGELMVLEGKIDPIAMRLDALASWLDGARPASTENVMEITTPPASLGDAQIERLRTQLAVLQRAVGRYESA